MRSKGIEPKPSQYDSILVGTIRQTLKMALSSEENEVVSMHPHLVRTAETEKFSAVSEQFTFCKEGDALAY